MNLCIKECTEKSNDLIRVKNDMINSNPDELLLTILDSDDSDNCCDDAHDSGNNDNDDNDYGNVPTTGQEVVSRASPSQGGASPSQGGATRSQGGANQRKIVNDEKGTFLYIDIILIIFYSII